MGKIYYTVRGLGAGFPVDWLDSMGKPHRLEGPFNTIDEAIREFKAQHAGAEYLAPRKWVERADTFAQARHELARWNSWVKGEKA